MARPTYSINATTSADVATGLKGRFGRQIGVCQDHILFCPEVLPIAKVEDYLKSVAVTMVITRYNS